jgi:heme-degrading monooxygenase HmoA
MPGNQGGWCLHRTAKNKAHSYLVTLWDDIHAATQGTARLPMEQGGQIHNYDVCATCSPNTQTESREVGDSNLIARLWRGIVPMHKADAYLDYLSDFGLRDYEAYDGFGGAHLLRAATNNTVEIVLLSFWHSWRSIIAYTGPDPEKARYYAYDLECLINPARGVELYEVSVAEAGTSRTKRLLCAHG